MKLKLSKTKEIVTENAYELSHLMKMTIGAVIVSMMTSVSTYHLTTQGSEFENPATAKDLTHALEREREVLHGPTQLGRVRYVAVSGSE